LEDPPASADGRRSSADGADGQETSLADNAAPRIGAVQRHTTKVTAVNVWNAVVLGESFIDKGVIRIEQRQDIPVFAHDAFKQHFRLALERLPKVFVEILRRRFDLRELAQIQPLAGEV